MGLTFPWPGMMMQHWTPEPLTKARPEDRAGYQRALAAVRARPTPRAPRGTGLRPVLDRQTGVRREIPRRCAGREGRGDRGASGQRRQGQGRLAGVPNQLAEAVRLADVAHTTTVQAIESFAAVAKNRADLGAIAVLAEYAYRPLKNKASQLHALLDQ